MRRGDVSAPTSWRWEAACAPHGARVDVSFAWDGGKIEICTIEDFDFDMHKGMEVKIGNGRNREQRSWFLQGRFVPL